MTHKDPENRASANDIELISKPRGPTKGQVYSGSSVREGVFVFEQVRSAYSGLESTLDNRLSSVECTSIVLLIILRQTIV